MKSAKIQRKTTPLMSTTLKVLCQRGCGRRKALIFRKIKLTTRRLQALHILGR